MKKWHVWTWSVCAASSLSMIKWEKNLFRRQVALVTLLCFWCGKYVSQGYFTSTSTAAMAESVVYSLWQLETCFSEFNIAHVANLWIFINKLSISVSELMYMWADVYVGYMYNLLTECKTERRVRTSLVCLLSYFPVK